MEINRFHFSIKPGLKSYPSWHYFLKDEPIHVDFILIFNSFILKIKNNIGTKNLLNHTYIISFINILETSNFK